MKLLKELHEAIADDVSYRIRKAFEALSHKDQIAVLNKAKVDNIDELIKQSKSHYNLLTRLTTEAAQPNKQKYIDAAKKAIENDDKVVQDVADHHNQKVDSVKHMNWFIKAVAIDLAAQDGNKEVFYESVNENYEYGLRWRQADKKGSISMKEKFFGSEKALELFANELETKDGFIEIVSWSYPAARGKPRMVIPAKTITEGVKHTPSLTNASVKAAVSVVADTKAFLSSMWNDPKSGVKKEFNNKESFIRDALPDHIEAAKDEFVKMFEKDVALIMKEELV